MSGGQAGAGAPRSPDTASGDQHLQIQESASERGITLSGRRDPLSQAPADESHAQRLLWLQRRRLVGLWVACDTCDKYRYLSRVSEPLQLPAKWYCNMNPDARYAKCSAPEVALSVAEEEDLIHGAFGAGSVVWAKYEGHPWWPAMVDDDPDTESFYWLNGFSDIPTYYNVVFFDPPNRSAERGWVATHLIKKYEHTTMKPRGKFAARIYEAQMQANDALKLSVAERFAKYSFLVRYHGPIVTPKDATEVDRKKRSKVRSNAQTVRVPRQQIIGANDAVHEPASLSEHVFSEPIKHKGKAPATAMLKDSLLQIGHETNITVDLEESEDEVQESKSKTRKSKVRDEDASPSVSVKKKLVTLSKKSMSIEIITETTLSNLRPKDISVRSSKHDENNNVKANTESKTVPVFKKIIKPKAIFKSNKKVQEISAFGQRNNIENSTELFRASLDVSQTQTVPKNDNCSEQQSTSTAAMNTAATDGELLAPTVVFSNITESEAESEDFDFSTNY